MRVEYRLAFGSIINVETANNLRTRICQILERQDFGALVVMFSSDGGSTDQSLELFNFIRQLPVPIGMHAVGHVGSAAIPVFLAGETRTGSPMSRFFLHEYDWTFKGRQTLNRIEEAVQRLRSDIEISRQIIETRTQVPGNILEALDGRSTPEILSAEQAKTHGFIDEVLELGQHGLDGMNVSVWSA